jgi:hypothetical protein
MAIQLSRKIEKEGEACRNVDQLILNTKFIHQALWLQDLKANN